MRALLVDDFAETEVIDLAAGNTDEALFEILEKYQETLIRMGLSYDWLKVPAAAPKCIRIAGIKMHVFLVERWSHWGHRKLADRGFEWSFASGGVKMHQNRRDKNACFFSRAMVALGA